MNHKTDTSGIECLIENLNEKKQYIEETKQKLHLKSTYDLINDVIEDLNEILNKLEKQ